MPFSPLSEVPFADHTSCVASLGQVVRDGGLGKRQWPVSIGDVAEAILVATREQARTGWAALWSGDIAIGKAGSFGCHAVDVGCFHILFDTHAGKVRIAVILGEEDNDIGFSFCRNKSLSAKEE
jgi:hypothetical protein